MIRIQSILCPVDFFPASRRALDYAIALARNYEAKLYILHVISTVIPSAYEYSITTAELTRSMEKTSRPEMEEMEKRATQAGVDAKIEVRTGDVRDEIKTAINRTGAGMVIMGTHGRRGFDRWFMGSTTESLLRHVPVPLLMISAPKPFKAPPEIKRILVTTDFSEGTPDVLAYAFSIAQESQAKITLLHVINDVDADVSGPYRDSRIKGIRTQLEKLVPPEARDWCEVTTRVERGRPFRRILEITKRDKIDLVAMNVHGKGMLDRALLGSTAERVIRGAPCPVLAVPPIEARRKARRKA